jgi:hypothetical protein
MSAFLILPAFITPTAWTSQMALSLYRYGPVPRLDRDEDWRDWASAVINIPAVAAANPPRPIAFSSFRDWASAFNLALAPLL